MRAEGEQLTYPAAIGITAVARRLRTTFMSIVTVRADIRVDFIEPVFDDPPRMCVDCFLLDRVPKIWADLGMPPGQAYTKGVRMVKTCMGTDFCRFGVQDSTSAGIELERRFENLFTPRR